LGQILAVLIGFALFISWSVATRDVADYNGILRGELSSQIMPSYQIQSVLQHPLDIIQIALNTLLTNGQSYALQFFGMLSVKYITLPATSMILCILMLGLSVSVFEKSKFPHSYSLIILADIFIGVVMVFAILYAVFTPIRAEIVDGVQGRYFIPFTILALSAISALMPKFKPEDSQWYEAVPKLFLYGTAISLSLTTFKFVYLVVTAIN
jgi:uncharacterized membrane protein